MKTLQAMALVLALILVGGPSALGQATNATLSGTVSDETGARIPGADIINERFRGSIRFDASNILNHPTPDTTPCLSIAGCGGQSFGEISSKGSATGASPGWRQFQARLRLEF